MQQAKKRPVCEAFVGGGVILAFIPKCSGEHLTDRVWKLFIIEFSLL